MQTCAEGYALTYLLLWLHSSGPFSRHVKIFAGTCVEE
jgi:hypothetical protein